MAIREVFVFLAACALCASASAIPLNAAEAETESPSLWGVSTLYGKVLAQSSCMSSLRSSGAMYAIRRECNNDAADCHTICDGLKDPSDEDAEFTCTDSIHIGSGEGGSLPGEFGLRVFKYSSSRVKGCGPNYCCCQQKAKATELVRESCKAILAAGESKGSGVYLVNPKGTADTAFEVYCDMATDGGGWTLWAAYAHKMGDNKPLVGGKMPVDVEKGYSHYLLDRAGFIDDDVSEIRFYCESSHHPRRIHFSTKNRQVELSAIDRSGELSKDAFRRGGKLLQGHTAHLPKSTTATGASSLFEDAFFDNDGHYWSVRPEDKHFRCDDSEEGEANTRHLIYFR